MRLRFSLAHYRCTIGLTTDRQNPLMAAPNDNKPKVEYRRLGKSGLRVSVPILGAMSIGSDKWGKWVINEDEVSNIYCPPHSRD